MTGVAYSGSENISFVEEDVFVVKVPLESLITDKVSNKVPDKVSDNITDIQRQVLMLVMGNNRISLSQLAEQVGISKRKMLDNINKLKNRNLIKRVGSSKGGYWEIIG